MADTPKQTKPTNNKRSQLHSQLKQAFPSFSDEKIRSVIAQCDDDEAKLAEWIDRHFESKGSTKDWNEVGKKSKQPSARDKKADDRAGHSKLPARGSKSGVRANGVDGGEHKVRGHSVTFAIPKNKHPTIIGNQGKTIQSLQSETNTRVIVPHRDDRSSFVTLVGDPAAVEVAKGRLEQLLGLTLKTGSLCTIALSIPKKAHSAIIGKGGQTLSELEKTYSCSIQFPTRQQESNEVQIQGVKEQCLQVQNVLSSLAAKENCSVQVLSSKFETGSGADGNNATLADTQQQQHTLHPHSTQAQSSQQQYQQAQQQSQQQGFASLNGTSDAIADAVGNIGAQLANTGAAAGNGSASTGSSGGIGMGVFGAQPFASSLLSQPHLHSPSSPSSPSAALLPNPQAQEDIKAAALANEIIDTFLGSGLSLNLQSRFQVMLLPTANMVQLHMRVRLHERLTAQRRKLQELERQNANEYVLYERLEQDVRHKEGLLEQLREDMRQLQQRLTATETELQKTRKEHASAQQIVESASKQLTTEKKQVELYEHALIKTETAAQQVTSAWDSWLKKLSQHNINDWEFSDMDTLLGCLGINPQFFSTNGIEPSMLACIDDCLLRQLTWNNERLRFGERRHLLIALRAILNAQRKPLAEGAQAAPSDVVTYLMSWGLNIQINPMSSSSKHIVAWSVEDVAAHFRAAGQEAAAAGCEAERVCGAVVLTMYRKDFFNLELPSLGDAIHMWKETSALQRIVFGKNTPQQAQLWNVDESPVQRLSPEDVAKCFEARDLHDLAQLCRREKVSGVVVASVRRMEDIVTVDFACPGDRIRFLKLCEQLTTEYADK